MAFIHNHALSFTLDFLGANLQHTDEANLFLALGCNTNDLTGLNGMLGIRQSTSGGSQAGGHESCAREDEADGTAVDLDCWDGGGVGVDETEVGNRRTVDGLEEEGGGVYCVESDTVRSASVSCMNCSWS